MEVKFDSVNYYLNRDEKLLNNVSFSVKKNSIVGIIGKSGSGKSLLFDLLSGNLKIKSGKIILDDIIINKKDLYDKKKLSNKVFYQSDDYCFSKKIILAEIKYFLKLKDLKFNQEELYNFLNLLGLDINFLNLTCKSLSSGNVILFKVLISLLSHSDLLLFDDNFNVLDLKNKKMLIRLFKNLKNNYNKTIMVINKDVDFIHRLCDQVIVMDFGKVVLAGDKYSVFTNALVLNKYNLSIPKVITFSNLVYHLKGVKIGYRDDINDLLKDIYRYVK